VHEKWSWKSFDTHKSLVPVVALCISGTVLGKPIEERFRLSALPRTATKVLSQRKESEGLLGKVVSSSAEKSCNHLLGNPF